ncbi:26S proteasome non-ATPase regulatory subunit 4, partial [Schistosoma japonicum]
IECWILEVAKSKLFSCFAMSQEATIIAVDNSDYMRNGDFFPSRLQAQNDAVSLICQSKRQRNPENTLGLLSLANTEVLCTLTNDVSKIYNRLHLVEPKGSIIFCSSIRVAHLALRHRQLRHQKMRIICFIGSPILEDEKELIKLAKRLKKEKVNVDIINFGENEDESTKVVRVYRHNKWQRRDRFSSHIMTSPVVAGEDGSGLPGTGLGLEFGLDGAEDPDLLYALRVSMEDQRMRQEHEVNADNETTTTVTTSLPAGAGTSEEAMLQQALAMSMQMNNTESPSLPMDIDLAAMSEEDQIAYALRMSLQQMGEETAHPSTTILESNKLNLSTSPTISTSTDLDVMYDAEFLESVLQSLPGVDTQNEDVRKAISDLTRSQSQGSSSKNEKGDEDQQNN